jgi:hypothetical protein
MVEFGAGGKVARREETTATEAEAGTNTVPGSTAATGSAIPAPAPSGGTTTGGRERRKRKAKGWYCPVCRQPYTSLLRLALPTTGKADTESYPVEVELARAPSRASVRTTHSRYAPSIAPTLPRGAEEMLDSLRPPGARDDDEDEHEHEHEHEAVPESERPQFILGNEIDTDDKREKAEVVHAENSHSGSEAFNNAQNSEEGRNKGWKEAP